MGDNSSYYIDDKVVFEIDFEAGLFSSRIFAAIEENDIAAFFQLLGSSNEDNLRNAERSIISAKQRTVDASKFYRPNPWTVYTPFLLCATYGRHVMLEYMLN